MFYVIADAEPFGLRLTPDEGRDITRITELIKAAAAEQLPVVHPDQPGFAGITIGQLSGPAHDPANSRRNVVTVSTGKVDFARPSTWTGAIDRSPCGTGTSARMAVLHAKGQLKLGDRFLHEGILGTVFTGEVVEETTIGPYRAVVPTITGSAWITGFSSYVLPRAVARAPCPAPHRPRFFPDRHGGSLGSGLTTDSAPTRAPRRQITLKRIPERARNRPILRLTFPRCRYETNGAVRTGRRTDGAQRIGQSKSKIVLPW